MNAWMQDGPLGRPATTEGIVTHTCTKHQPGARACYVGCRCRCRPCTDAATAWQRRFNHLKRTSRSLTVDVVPVRTYLLRLDLSLTELAARSGINRTTIARILSGQTMRIAPDRARALMSIHAGGVAEHGLVDSVGTRRRLQSLAALGWTAVDIAPSLGVAASRVRSLRRQQGPVEAATAIRVAAIYDQLWDAAPPDTPASRSMRSRAAHKGWPPPLAWDDDEIDDPAATPHEWRRTPRTTASRADVLDAALSGASLGDLMERFGLSADAVEKHLERAGRGDLMCQIRPASMRDQRAA